MGYELDQADIDAMHFGLSEEGEAMLADAFRNINRSYDGAVASVRWAEEERRCPDCGLNKHGGGCASKNPSDAEILQITSFGNLANDISESIRRNGVPPWVSERISRDEWMARNVIQQRHSGGRAFIALALLALVTVCGWAACYSSGISLELVP